MKEISVADARKICDDESYVQCHHLGVACGGGSDCEIIFKDEDGRFWEFSAVEFNGIHPNISARGVNETCINFVKCKEVFPQRTLRTTFVTEKHADGVKEAASEIFDLAVAAAKGKTEMFERQIRQIIVQHLSS